MKKTIIIITLLSLYGCASSFTSGSVTSIGAVVSENNYKYLGRVEAKTTTSKIFFPFVIRLESGDVYSRAMKKLKNKANRLQRDNGNSKIGLINITQETYYDGFFIFGAQTVIISADVVAFY